MSFKKIKITAFLLAITFMFLFVSCNKDDTSSVNSGGEDKPQVSELIGYSRLNEKQREYYDILKSGDIKPEEIYEFETPQDYNDVMKALYYYNVDNEIFYGFEGYPNYYEIVLTDEYLDKYPLLSYNTVALHRIPDAGDFIVLDGIGAVKGIKNVAFTGAEVYDYDKLIAEFDKEVDNWMKELPSLDASDYEKVFALTNLMCEKIEYQSGIAEHTGDAYGAVVNKVAVCQGYAQAFQYFAKRLGLECIFVTGEAGDAHGWNMVKVDGKWYHIDTTWIDTDSSVPDYTYFLKSDEHFKNHSHEFHVFPYEEYREEDAALYKDFMLPNTDENYKITLPESDERRDITINYQVAITNFGKEDQNIKILDKEASVTFQIPKHWFVDNKSDKNYEYFYTFNNEEERYHIGCMASKFLFEVDEGFIMNQNVCTIQNGTLMTGTEVLKEKIDGKDAVIYHNSFKDYGLEYYNIYIRVDEKHIAFFQLDNIIVDIKTLDEICKSIKFN